MAESVSDLVEELRREVNESIATLTWARAGFVKAVEFLESQAVHPDNPDPRIILGHGDPNSPGARQLAEWRRSETIAKLSKGGDAFNRVGRDWVVALYQTWEDSLRPRLAKGAGVEKAKISSVVFGDLRHLRHDIVHCLGLATAEHSGKAVLLQWFQVGESIEITNDHLLDFLRQLDRHPIEIDGQPV
jgi:hypothetical protein